MSRNNLYRPKKRYMHQQLYPSHVHKDVDLQPRRGGFLTIYLLFMIAFSTISVFHLFMNSIDVRNFTALDIALHLSTAITMLGYVGIWQWRRWAYYLVILLHIILLLYHTYAFITGRNTGYIGFLLFFSSAVSPLLFYYLVRNKLRYFE